MPLVNKYTLNVVGATPAFDGLCTALRYTSNGFIPEFEAEVIRDKKEKLTVEEFANELSNFFCKQWKKLGMPEQLPQGTPDMSFLVGGYDPGAQRARPDWLRVSRSVGVSVSVQANSAQPSQ